MVYLVNIESVFGAYIPVLLNGPKQIVEFENFQSDLLAYKVLVTNLCSDSTNIIVSQSNSLSKQVKFWSIENSNTLEFYLSFHIDHHSRELYYKNNLQLAFYRYNNACKKFSLDIQLDFLAIAGQFARKYLSTFASFVFGILILMLPRISTKIELGNSFRPCMSYIIPKLIVLSFLRWTIVHLFPSSIGYLSSTMLGEWSSSLSLEITTLVIIAIVSFGLVKLLDLIFSTLFFLLQKLFICIIPKLNDTFYTTLRLALISYAALKLSFNIPHYFSLLFAFVDLSVIRVWYANHVFIINCRRMSSH